MDPSLVLTSTQKECRFRKREKIKSVACPELIHADEPDQIEARGDELSDIARMDDLEPINDPTNDDLEIRNTNPDGPDVSMLGNDMIWHKYILDDIILRYLIFINIFITL